jgi:hypothetical protein
VTHARAEGPESSPDGPLVQMSAVQLRFIELWVAQHTGRAGVSIEERGQGYLEVVVWDKSNVELARRTVFPTGNEL